MSRFLDSSALGTNGVMLIVNGVEVNSLTLPASAIQQIKINQDPFFAGVPSARPRAHRDCHQAWLAELRADRQLRVS